MIRPIYFLRQGNNWLKIFARLSHNFDKRGEKSLSNFCSSFSCWRKWCGNVLLLGCKKEKEVPRFARVVLMLCTTYSLCCKMLTRESPHFIGNLMFFRAATEWGGLASFPSMSTLTECDLSRNHNISILLIFFLFIWLANWAFRKHF